MSEIKNKKLNPKWDSLLTPYQRGILTEPGFGIIKELPYLKEEEVRTVMIIIEECIRHIDLMMDNTDEHAKTALLP